MKFWIGTLLLLLAGTPIMAQEGTDWRTFVSGGGRFSARLPGTPTEKTQTSGTVTTHSFTLGVNDVAYIVSYSDLPAKSMQAGPAAILKAARDGGINNVKGKLISEQPVAVNGYPARDVTASVPLDKNPGVARFRLVLAKSRL